MFGLLFCGTLFLFNPIYFGLSSRCRRFGFFSAAFQFLMNPLCFPA